MQQQLLVHPTPHRRARVRWWSVDWRRAQANGVRNGKHSNVDRDGDDRDFLQAHHFIDKAHGPPKTNEAVPNPEARPSPMKTGRTSKERAAAGQGLAEDASVVSRVLRLVTAVSQSDGTRSVAELAVETGLPKPTVHRLCQQLERGGYFLRDLSSRHYGVGPRLWELGLNIVNSGLRPERRAILQRLSNETGETCNLSMRVRDELVYIDRVESRWPLRLHLEPGSHVPLHCTASGKLLLSAMSKARRHRLLTITGLPAHTPKTITDLDAMEREAERIRQRGYSIDDEEFLEGLVALAVPLHNRNNHIVAGIAVHGPKPRLSVDRALSHLPSLKKAALDLEEMLVEGPS